MSSDIDIHVIQNTQEMLNKYIKKPLLTEKLLRKPPFRFLHDIVTNVIRETGFLKGLYSERELVSENVKEKDDKIAFLNKLIDATKTITGMELGVRSSKIIAGFEPNETNILLQAIGKALEQKLDSTEYVNQLKLQKQASKKKLETVKNLEKKSKTTKTKEQPLKSTKENVVRTGKNNVTATSLGTKLNSKRSSSKDSKTIRAGDHKIEKKIKQKKEILDGKEKTVEIENLHNLTQPNLENEQLQPNIENKTREANEPLMSQHTHNATDEINNVDTLSDIETQNTTGTIKPHLLNSEVSVLETSETKGKDNEDNVANNISQKEETLVTENPPEPVDTEMDIKQKLPLSKPKSALRPPSVRPSSARPGAPRLQRSDSILLKEKEVVPAGKVEVIDEISTNNYIDEEETVTIEAAPEVEYQAPLIELPTDKGHLVEQILQQINSSDIEPVKSNINVEWEQAGLRNRNTAIKEVEQLKGAIQDLTKMVNPLGKLINYLHEDIEAMYSELDMWSNSVRQIMIEVANQKKVTDESNVPLQIKLDEIEENIIKHQQQIVSTYSDIMRNEERIQDLLIK